MLLLVVILLLIRLLLIILLGRVCEDGADGPKPVPAGHQPRVLQLQGQIITFVTIITIITILTIYYYYYSYYLLLLQGPDESALSADGSCDVSTADKLERLRSSQDTMYEAASMSFSFEIAVVEHQQNGTVRSNFNREVLIGWLMRGCLHAAIVYIAMLLVIASWSREPHNPESRWPLNGRAKTANTRKGDEQGRRFG